MLFDLDPFQRNPVDHGCRAGSVHHPEGAREMSLGSWPASLGSGLVRRHRLVPFSPIAGWSFGADARLTATCRIVHAAHVRQPCGS